MTDLEGAGAGNQFALGRSLSRFQSFSEPSPKGGRLAWPRSKNQLRGDGEGRV